MELGSSLFDRVDYGTQFIHGGTSEHEGVQVFVLEVSYDMTLTSEREAAASTLVDTEGTGTLYFDNQRGRLLEFSTAASYGIERDGEFGGYSGTDSGVRWTVTPAEE